MQPPDVTFYRYFQAVPRPRGLDHIKGRQDLDVLPTDFRTFLADTQKAFNHSFTLAEAPMAELGRALVPYLDYLDSPEECAHAFESEGYHFIGISIPMIEQLRDSAERLLRTEQVVALLSIPAGYVNRHNAIGGILTIKLLFISAHEFGHHLWGHASDFRPESWNGVEDSEATRVLEGFRHFELVVRLKPEVRQNAQDFANLLVSAPNGQRIPLAQLAHIGTETGPVEIARENGQRRISVEVNVRGRDIGSFVQQAQADVAREIQLPSGYIMEWGGLWENLESGRNRLLVVVPVTFLLIFIPSARMTYDLLRLRLHGIIDRIPPSHRYQLTADGLRIALFFSRTYARLLRPKLAEIIPRPEPISSALRIAFDRLNSAIDACCEEERLVA